MKKIFYVVSSRLLKEQSGQSRHLLPRKEPTTAEHLPNMVAVPATLLSMHLLIRDSYLPVRGIDTIVVLA